MTCTLNILTLLVIAGCLLLPDSAYANDWPGWYLDTSCNTLAPRIRQSYANALSMSQAVLSLSRKNDPNFINLVDMMLGNRALNPALVADAVCKSFLLGKKIICRSLERYILTPAVYVARHHNVQFKLKEEVTRRQKIYENWEGNVVSKHLESHNLTYHKADIHPQRSFTAIKADTKTKRWRSPRTARSH